MEMWWQNYIHRSYLETAVACDVEQQMEMHVTHLLVILCLLIIDTLHQSLSNLPVVLSSISTLTKHRDPQTHIGKNPWRTKQKTSLYVVRRNKILVPLRRFPSIQFYYWKNPLSLILLYSHKWSFHWRQQEYHIKDKYRIKHNTMFGMLGFLKDPRVLTKEIKSVASNTKGLGFLITWIFIFLSVDMWCMLSTQTSIHK